MGKKYIYISLSLHITFFLLIAFFSWRKFEKINPINTNTGVKQVQIKQFTKPKPVPEKANPPKKMPPKEAPVKKATPPKKAEKPVQTKKSIPIKKEEIPTKTPERQEESIQKIPDKKMEEDLLREALNSLEKKQEESQTKAEEESVANALSGLVNSNTNSVELGSTDTYATMVGAIIRSAWFFPSLGRNENFRTVIRIKIDSFGNILSYSVEESSGREDFDNSAIRAVSTLKTLLSPPDSQPLDFIINFNLLED
ncbi:MAG: TonB family protein [Desulfovibrionaceae bacterium]